MTNTKVRKFGLMVAHNSVQHDSALFRNRDVVLTIFVRFVQSLIGCVQYVVTQHALEFFFKLGGQGAMSSFLHRVPPEHSTNGERRW